MHNRLKPKKKPGVLSEVHEDVDTVNEKKLQEKLAKGCNLIEALLRTHIERDASDPHTGEPLGPSIQSLSRDECPKLPSSLRSLHLQRTQGLLEVYPEFTSLWNYRRSLLLDEYLSLEYTEDAAAARSSSSSPNLSAGIDLLVSELAFSEAILCKVRKSYSVWFHRKWIFQSIHNVVDEPEQCIGLFNKELNLCGRLLDEDDRNFHCWNHRAAILALLVASRHRGELVQKVVFPLSEELRRTALGGTKDNQLSTSEARLSLSSRSSVLLLNREYSRNLINRNFSNFSAWHLRMKTQEAYGDTRVENALELHHAQELDLLEQGLYTEPNDESLWTYYNWFVMWRARKAAPEHIGLRHVSLHSATGLRADLNEEAASFVVCLVFAQPTICSAAEVINDTTFYGSPSRVAWYPCCRSPFSALQRSLKDVTFSVTSSGDCTSIDSPLLEGFNDTAEPLRYGLSDAALKQPSFCWIGFVSRTEIKPPYKPMEFVIDVGATRKIPGGGRSHTVLHLSIQPSDNICCLENASSSPLVWWATQDARETQDRNIKENSAVPKAEEKDRGVPKGVSETRYQDWNLLVKELAKSDLLLKIEDGKCKHALLFNYEIYEALQILYERLSSEERQHLIKNTPPFISTLPNNAENLQFSTARVQLLSDLVTVDPTRRRRYTELIEREELFKLGSNSRCAKVDEDMPLMRLPPAEYFGWGYLLRHDIKRLDLSNKAIDCSNLWTSGIHMLFQLTSLNLSWNRLDDLNAVISALPNCPRLRNSLVVDLTGNPLQFSDHDGDHHQNDDKSHPATSYRMVESRKSSVILQLKPSLHSSFLPKQIIVTHTPLAGFCKQMPINTVAKKLNPYAVLVSPCDTTSSQPDVL